MMLTNPTIFIRSQFLSVAYFWTIYDIDGHFEAVRFVAIQDEDKCFECERHKAESLEHARSFVPRALANHGRRETDAKNIKEVWA